MGQGVLNILPLGGVKDEVDAAIYRLPSEGAGSPAGDGDGRGTPGTSDAASTSGSAGTGGAAAWPRALAPSSDAAVVAAST
jgi:hypothetical protein